MGEQMDAAAVRRLLPKRRSDGHKGTFGKIYVYGGCVGYTGAPVYAGEAAVRTGSGLVYVGVPEEIYPIVAARCAAAMAQPVPAEYDRLFARMANCNAVVIGPGLAENAKTAGTVERLLRDLACPVILDAGGINVVSTHIDVLKNRRSPTVVTPHAMEFRRLGGDPAQGREAAASALARELGCTVVLKGPGTVTAAPDGRVRVNSTGNCGMAKGGSGDVLSGMIASLAGQGAGIFDAASCAVWLHGYAGDLCAAARTPYAMTPTDMIDSLPAAFRALVDSGEETPSKEEENPCEKHCFLHQC